MTTTAPDLGILKGLARRLTDPTAWDGFVAQGERCGWCTNPVRLVGSTTTINTATGEVIGRWSTNSQPDRVLLKRCGTRRATRCASCATLYAADARALVRAGLSGGKGIPATVADHPAIFVTLTAPSFGTVHRAGDKCVEGRGNCPHDRPRACTMRHDNTNELVGTPICFECYDYQRAVLWNALCPELWRRTTIALRRQLARQLGLTDQRFNEVVRVSFTKVAEYQRRGVVHLHAIIRIDGRTLDSHDMVAPPTLFDTTALIAATHAAARHAAVAYPAPMVGAAVWGTQIDTRVIQAHTEQPSGSTSGAGGRAVANYLAKYATKSTDPDGVLDRRIRGLGDITHRTMSDHHRQLVTTAWNLGANPALVRLRLQAWAHTFGFRGHWLTKSRRYSITFAHLRHERSLWQHNRHHPTNLAGAHGSFMIVGDWEWEGIGWTNRADQWLTQQRQPAAVHARVLAREHRSIHGPDHEH